MHSHEPICVLHLTDGFRPLMADPIPFERFLFPSGVEPHFKLKRTDLAGRIVFITARIESMNDFFTLFLAVDALRRERVEGIGLYLAYMPFARQDRAMVAGEPLSLKVAACMLNAANFIRVFILDPHSDTTLALVNNSTAVTNDALVIQALATTPNDDVVWVAPDAGAQKKIFSLAKRLESKSPIVTGTKTRNLATGEILRTELDHPEMVKGKHAVIIDDICDGGRTFTELAGVLLAYGASKVSLIVTHGLFTKGLSPFVGLINDIHCTDSFTTPDKRQMAPSPGVTVHVHPVSYE